VHVENSREITDNHKLLTNVIQLPLPVDTRQTTRLYSWFKRPLHKNLCTMVKIWISIDRTKCYKSKSVHAVIRQMLNITVILITIISNMKS